MTDSDSAYKKLLNTLKENKVRADLIARLFDPALGMQEDRSIRIFIPDLHMLSETGQARFPAYGFHSDLARKGTMVGFLRALSSFAKQLLDAYYMEVYQIGDFVDLWREDPFSNNPSGILATNSAVWDLLYGNLQASFKDPRVPVYFMRGNHDFSIMDQSEYNNWQRAYFSNDDQVAILHGDVLDWLEKLVPDWLERAVVYLTGTVSGKRNFSDKEVQNENERLHQLNQNSGRYRWAKSYRLGERILTDPRNSTGPAADNVIRVKTPHQKVGEENDSEDDLRTHELIGPAYDLAEELVKTRQKRIKLMVIGHTHHARLVQYTKDQEVFVLMDCGAWTETYWVGPLGQPDRTDHSRQVGVVIGNDLRIYQIALL
ncbi:MAG: metallophosphoesterase [Deltaproteobacteria bacterium]|nr:metallophosphoesterase [Deltaproteobacteria bacterium]